MFLGLEFPQFTRYPLYCVGFEEGNGPHQLFLGGQYSANPSGGYCIRAGTGGAGISVGDITIKGVHLVTSSAGARLYGPSDNQHRQRIVLTGCKFEALPSSPMVLLSLAILQVLHK